MTISTFRLRQEKKKTWQQKCYDIFMALAGLKHHWDCQWEEQTFMTEKTTTLKLKHELNKTKQNKTKHERQ